ncbi:Phosphatidic acid phosphatase type 2/haloperoxidase domain-containing protein [Nocardiopsis gilva]|uniref:phosphatase PAP2 family protein n=1 Tax=Nocardiopsis gilva TaxID=280236 RepID=UPI0039EF214B
MSFPLHRSTAGHRAVMGVAAAGSAAAFAVTYALLVHTPAGQRIEDGILGDAYANLAVSLRGGVTEWGALLSGLHWLTAPMILVAGLAVVAVTGLAQRRVRVSAVALGMVVAAAGATFVLKAGLLSRPPLNPGSGWGGGGNSFPSGHVTLAVALVLALLLVVPARIRPLVAGAGALWSGAVAITTVAQGWHRPSDVIGSTLLAFTAFCVATAVLSPPRRPGVSASLLAAAWAWLPVFVLTAVPLELLALSPSVGAPGLVGVDVAAWLAAGVSAVPLVTAPVLLSLLESEEPDPVVVGRREAPPAAERPVETWWEMPRVP